MSRPPKFPFATPEELGLPGRPGYDVIQESRFDVLEEELAALLVPWDSDADAARIAREHKLPDDARFIAAARARMRASHVDPYKESKTRRPLFSVCLRCGNPLSQGRDFHVGCERGPNETPLKEDE